MLTGEDGSGGLERVESKDDGAPSFAHAAHGVGRPDISRAQTPQVNAPQAPKDEPKGDRAEKVRGEQ